MCCCIFTTLQNSVSPYWKFCTWSKLETKSIVYKSLFCCQWRCFKLLIWYQTLKNNKLFVITKIASLLAMLVINVFLQGLCKQLSNWIDFIGASSFLIDGRFPSNATKTKIGYEAIPNCHQHQHPSFLDPGIQRQALQGSSICNALAPASSVTIEHLVRRILYFLKESKAVVYKRQVLHPLHEGWHFLFHKCQVPTSPKNSPTLKKLEWIEKLIQKRNLLWDGFFSLSSNTTAMILLPEHSSHQLGGRQGETLMQ